MLRDSLAIKNFFTEASKKQSFLQSPERHREKSKLPYLVLVEHGRLSVTPQSYMQGSNWDIGFHLSPVIIFLL